MKILVISPHPDDELIGIGGTLLKRKVEGNEIGWLIMTEMSEKDGWNPKQIDIRQKEINSVRKGLEIKEHNLFKLKFTTTKLDQYPIASIIKEVNSVFKKFQPSEIFLPHFGDIHTDHKITFQVGASCSKWFRNKSIRRIFSYETISETEYNLELNKTFTPNYFSDISDYIDKKINLLNTYKSEIQKPPFPRSNEVIKSLAIYRGSQAGCKYAESFNLIKAID